jgi:hypothetical protein
VVDDGSNGTEKDLYLICNEILGTSFSDSDEMFENLGVSDDEDDLWEEINGGGVVSVTVRYAGYGQELGIDDGIYKAVVSGIPDKVVTYGTSYFVADNDFAFVEKYDKGREGKGTWYSDDRNSPNVDHFLAFDVTELYNSKFEATVNKAWLIAFEDLPDGGDHDYNDLVAVVADVRPTWAEEIMFEADAGVGSVDLEWTAVSECNVLGYNVLRARGMDGVFSQVNDVLISAKGSIETTVDYIYTDKGVKNGQIYRYKLIEVQADGQVAVHGDETVFPGLLQLLGR